MIIFLVQSALGAVSARGPLWDGFGYVVTVLLLVLLVQKELVRAHGGLRGLRAEKWMHAFDLAIWPFGLAFAVVVVIHLIDILGDR
jgi:hypothetical protein